MAKMTAEQHARNIIAEIERESEINYGAAAQWSAGKAEEMIVNAIRLSQCGEIETPRFAPYERVRLTDEGAAMAPKFRGHIGTVQRYTQRGMVMVRFDGRKTADKWEEGYLTADLGRSTLSATGAADG